MGLVSRWRHEREAERRHSERWRSDVRLFGRRGRIVGSMLAMEGAALGLLAGALATVAAGVRIEGADLGIDPWLGPALMAPSTLALWCASSWLGAEIDLMEHRRAVGHGRRGADPLPADGPIGGGRTLSDQAPGAASGEEGSDSLASVK